MADGIGQGQKKETVYGDPAVKTAEGTVYGGPKAGGPPPYSAGSVTTGSPAAAKGAKIFYLIAGFTVINTVLMFAGIQFAIGVGSIRLSGGTRNSIILLNLIAAGVFVLLGFLAQGGSKIIFVIGMLLYTGDLLLLIVSDAARHILSIVIHGLFLYYLFAAYRELPE